MNSQRAQLWFKELQKDRKKNAEVLQKPCMIGVWKFVKDTYSDQAHFIYELLQNADDAKASKCRFILEPDGLTFVHDGKIHFNVSDPYNEEIDKFNGKLGHINSITSIGNTSKVESEIGKFGVGFKAVFLYTQSPRIFDDNFKFRISNYIIPNELQHDHPSRKSGETLFYFPFDLTEKSSEDAFQDIIKKLKSLLFPILFLENLNLLEWRAPGESGSYSKSINESFTQEATEVKLVTLHNYINGEDKPERLWLFSRHFKSEKELKKPICVGFFLNNDGKLDVNRNYDAFCYFPTKESTKLKFAIHGPFLLTNNREGIKAGEDWNQVLIENLASLAADSLMILKQIGIDKKIKLIDDTLLDIIPYSKSSLEDRYSFKISFVPFYDEIFKLLENEIILPGKDFKYYSSEKAYWPADPELPEIFNDDQLSSIIKDNDCGWVFTTKPRKRVDYTNYELASYVTKITQGQYDANFLLRRFDEKFIENQSFEWLNAFYEYLLERTNLWETLKYIPHILDQDGKACSPYDKKLNTLKIFLTGDRRTAFSTIHPNLVSNETSRKYFEKIGISKPNLKDEIYLMILPQYQTESIRIDDDTIKLHFLNFLDYFEQCNSYSEREFIDQIRKVKFLHAVKSSEPETLYFAKPDEIYLRSPELEAYFGDRVVYFFHEEYYSEIIRDDNRHLYDRFIKSLGIKDKPELKSIDLHPSDQMKISFGLHSILTGPRSFYSEELIDKEIEGLEQAINNIDLDVSVFIWNILLQYIGGKSIDEVNSEFCGIFIYKAPRKHLADREQFESTLLKTIRQKPWLYDSSGGLCRASELTSNDLHSAYQITGHSGEILLQILGILSANLRDLNDKEKKWLENGKMLEESGVDLKDIREFVNWRNNFRNPRHQNEQEIEKELPESIVTGDTGPNRDTEPVRPEKTGDAGERTIHAIRNKPIDRDEGESIDIEEDEFIKPTVNFEKQIDRIIKKNDIEIDNVKEIQDLTEIVEQSEKYSFKWIKSLLELEIINSAESNAKSQQITIHFSKVEKEPNTESIIILKHPDRYIPQSIEDIGDLSIKLFFPDQTKSVTIEVVNVREYTLRAKLKSYSDIDGLNLSNISSAVVDIKNPIFILEELLKAYDNLPLADEYNLRDNITWKIEFIFGPPGTGKTTYLARNVIMPLMKAPEETKILVLTPTNKAADVLTTRLIKEMASDETYFQWLARFGITGDHEIEESGLLVSKDFDIAKKKRLTLITTIARFPYDFFMQENVGRILLKDIEWDYIIIDEASMIPLASILYPLYYKRHLNFIVAGDPFQIPPITAVEQWKDENIYTLVELNKFIDPSTVPHDFKIVNLLTQYRSIPSIGELFSHFTYHGVLKHYRKSADQRRIQLDGLSLSDINIVHFPVNSFESIYKSRRLKNTPYHIYSALFTVELVKYLINKLNGKFNVVFKIGVITPYRAQASLIDKLLAQLKIRTDRTEIQVGTIHGFQGDECDLVITVFNPPPTISSSKDMFLNKQNILNVSISRARDYLIVLIPDEKTENRDKLYKIKRIEKSIYELASDRYTKYSSDQIEKILFGSNSYIFRNSFATTHQLVNVYSIPENRYEIRCEDNAIDVQIRMHPRN